MSTEGFYKKNENEMLYAPNIVNGPDYLLISQDKETYTYPVDGWVWANSFDDAIVYFASQNNQSAQPFDVQPENYKLAVSKEDETEFSKLITLLNLALQQNKILLSSEITIWDHVKQGHSISVERFLEVMVDYGLYCYQHRS
jgi:hypothetical protein